MYRNLPSEWKFGNHSRWPLSAPLKMYATPAAFGGSPSRGVTKSKYIACTFSGVHLAAAPSASRFGPTTTCSEMEPAPCKTSKNKSSNDHKCTPLSWLQDYNICTSRHRTALHTKYARRRAVLSTDAVTHIRSAGELCVPMSRYCSTFRLLRTAVLICYLPYTGVYFKRKFHKHLYEYAQCESQCLLVQLITHSRKPSTGQLLVLRDVSLVNSRTHNPDTTQTSFHSDLRPRNSPVTPSSHRQDSHQSTPGRRVIPR